MKNKTSFCGFFILILIFLFLFPLSILAQKPKLKVIGVIHWPKVFKKGDRVVTSFRLENKAKVAANKVSVILYVNGEEKNKVEDITIPSGGYADIEMPWIAVKGKNEVNIVVI